MKPVTVGCVAALGALALVAGCTAAQPMHAAAPGRATSSAAHARPIAVQATPAAPSSPAPTTSPASPPARPDPCARNSARQLVRVSIHRQRLWMCHRARLVRAVPVTTGIPGRWTHTPRGDYRIQALDRHSTLTLITGQQYQVQYWIPFDAPLFGFHDAPWQKSGYGTQRYRRHGSHGCVHMPLRAIAFLYHWAHVGTAVRIRA